jgi:hypothetical protein
MANTNESARHACEAEEAGARACIAASPARAGDAGGLFGTGRCRRRATALRACSRFSLWVGVCLAWLCQLAHGKAANAGRRAVALHGGRGEHGVYSRDSVRGLGGGAGRGRREAEQSYDAYLRALALQTSPDTHMDTSARVFSYARAHADSDRAFFHALRGGGDETMGAGQDAQQDVRVGATVMIAPQYTTAEWPRGLYYALGMVVKEVPQAQEAGAQHGHATPGQNVTAGPAAKRFLVRWHIAGEQKKSIEMEVEGGALRAYDAGSADDVHYRATVMLNQHAPLQDTEGVFREALHIDPHHCDAMAGLALLVHAKMRDPNAAEALLNRCVRRRRQARKPLACTSASAARASARLALPPPLQGPASPGEPERACGS